MKPVDHLFGNATPAVPQGPLLPELRVAVVHDWLVSYAGDRAVGRARARTLVVERDQEVSASPFAGSPSRSCAATRFTASTGSGREVAAIPDGVTSVGVSSVTAPMTPTLTPSTSITAYSGRTGFVVSLA